MAGYTSVEGETVRWASRAARPTRCHRCGSPNVRTVEGARSEKLFLFTRATYCLQCWWSIDERLVDDEAKQAAEAAGTRNTNATRRQGR